MTFNAKEDDFGAPEVEGEEYFVDVFPALQSFRGLRSFSWGHREQKKFLFHAAGRDLKTIFGVPYLFFFRFNTFGYLNVCTTRVMIMPVRSLNIPRGRLLCMLY